MAPIFVDRNSSTRRAEAAPEFYRSYLNSPSWRMTRNRALRLAGYRCQRCGTKRDLNVHHTTYARLGAEIDTDLEVLCFGCHNGHHVREAEQTDSRVYLRLVSDVVAATPFASFSDIADDVKRLCVRHRVRLDVPAIDRAISLVCATRLKGPKPAAPSVDSAPPDAPLTHAQAVEFLARVRVTLNMPTAAAKPMPIGRLLRPGQADRLKALAMVTAEIAAAAERCDLLESQS